MNKLERIKELEEQVKQIQEEIQTLKNMNKVWKPEVGEEFWTICTNGFIYNSTWNDTEHDKNSYLVGNCYRTREEAEQALEIKKIDTELRRYALEHNENLDWEDTRHDKYYIGHLTDDKELDIDWVDTFKSPNQIYFTSREIALAAIEAIGRDRVEKWARY